MDDQYEQGYLCGYETASDEAADEIKRLRRRNDLLENLDADLAEHVREIERLQAALKEAIAAKASAENEARIVREKFYDC